MCDQDHFYEDMKKYTRRDVGTFAAAIGVVAMLPQSAWAVDTKESNVTIKTPDGECDAYFVTPTTGAHGRPHQAPVALQRRVSLVLVTRTQVQPVSLQTRSSPAPGAP